MRFLIEKVKLVTLVTLVTHHVNPTRMRAHTRTCAGANLYMCHHVSHPRLDNMRTHDEHRTVNHTAKDR